MRKSFLSVKAHRDENGEVKIDGLKGLKVNKGSKALGAVIHLAEREIGNGRGWMDNLGGYTEFEQFWAFHSGQECVTVVEVDYRRNTLAKVVF